MCLVFWSLFDEQRIVAEVGGTAESFNYVTEQAGKRLHFLSGDASGSRCNVEMKTPSWWAPK